MREAILFGLAFLIWGALMFRAKRVTAGRGIGAFILAFIITTIFSRCWVEVPPGQVGTIYDPFGGGIQNADLGGGWHLIKPWDNLQLWTVRTQEYTMSGERDEGAIVGDDSMVCQTKEGLQVKVDSTVIFHIDPGYAHRLWKSVGPNYINTIVRPAAREAVRSVVSQYPIMSVYSNAAQENLQQTGVTSYPGKRKEVEDGIFAALSPPFEAKGIKLERVLLRNVDYMSEQYENAIVNKQVAQQQVLTQQYTLEIERIKAQQKVTQSEGQAEAIRLRGIALRANMGVVRYEFVRNLPDDMEIKVLPGGTSVLLNMPQEQAQQ
jgi:regulator of protease activity HflC (stomatin/prohibitin superfamily)